MKPYKNIKVAGVTFSEHRYVWEQAHGPIPDGLLVHHINEDGRDNRLENLQLMTHEEHSRHHNDKHPRVTTCAVCEFEFEPHATKRARTRTCSAACRRELLSAKACQRYSATDHLTRSVAAHVRSLLSAGMSQRAVATAAGVSPGVISKLVGDHTKAVKVATADRLLALHVLSAATGIPFTGVTQVSDGFGLIRNGVHQQATNDVACGDAERAA